MGTLPRDFKSQCAPFFGRFSTVAAIGGRFASPDEATPTLLKTNVRIVLSLIVRSDRLEHQLSFLHVLPSLKCVRRSASFTPLCLERHGTASSA